MVLLAVSLAGRAPAAAPERVLAGHWEGAFSRLGSVQLVTLDIAPPEAAGAALGGTYDMPALGLFGQPLDSLVATDSTVSFRLIYGRFDMRLHAADLEMTGENRAWRPTVALHLARAGRPAPAFDTLAVATTRAGAVIRGTLYLPRARAPVPAMVVAGGSVQTTREDWRYRGRGPTFARLGIATLVYDRRGHGASGGVRGDPDLRDEADDVLALVAELRRNRAIDPARIGVQGLSRGGWVAALAAAKSRSVGFVVLECGAAVDPIEQEVQRVAHTPLEDSLTAEDVSRAAEYTRLMARVVVGSAPWTDLERASAAARGTRWERIVQLPGLPADLDWWRRNSIDMPAVLRTVRVPVLALFGGTDDLVPPGDNAEPMRAALAAGGNDDLTMRIVPGAGHGLFRNARLEGDEWKWPAAYWVWSAKASGVFEEVGGWVLAR